MKDSNKSKSKAKGAQSRASRLSSGVKKTSTTRHSLVASEMLPATFVNEDQKRVENGSLRFWFQSNNGK